LWDRGDTVGEVTLTPSGRIIAFIHAQPLPDDPDHEKLYARGTAFPGFLSLTNDIGMPENYPLSIESIEELDDLFKAAKITAPGYNKDLNPRNPDPS
jgi:hypothetical protein